MFSFSREQFDEDPFCECTYATFLLRGDALDPDEVSAALGLTPTQALVKGQERPPGDPNPRQPTGVWLLDTKHSVESTCLERHLVHLLDAVEPAAGALNALRKRDDLEAEFSCYWVSALGYGGPMISPATLARIAALDARLGIDFSDA